MSQAAGNSAPSAVTAAPQGTTSAHLGHVTVTLDATHLYPGTQLTLPAAPAELTELTLCFSDGTTAAAELVEGAGGRRLLRVDGYRTAAGTRIPAKLWPLRADPDGRLTLRRAFPVG
jgi:hypothetical protein